MCSAAASTANAGGCCYAELTGCSPSFRPQLASPAAPAHIPARTSPSSPSTALPPTRPPPARRNAPRDTGQLHRARAQGRRRAPRRRRRTPPLRCPQVRRPCSPPSTRPTPGVRRHYDWIMGLSVVLLIWTCYFLHGLELIMLPYNYVQLDA
ncbi:hypothetical protein BRADI_2g60281v3 [Brachypodium distachyon]|uniref:Uncharacterized protein n=1 Tax=Brachypodium distachyon TaxID=15368 RepID=A0A2K2DH04_BRADI|nr:hypothetical protein BRADI_2g60281v3 [Brachypodium distachyon]